MWKCGFYNIKLISQTSNQVILLARFFLHRIMLIKFISMLPERLKNMKPNCLYSTFCGEIYHHQANSPQKVEYKQLGFIFFKRSGAILINLRTLFSA